MTKIERAIKELEKIEQCGCFDEADGEGMDTEHKTSITKALVYLRAIQV